MSSGDPIRRPFGIHQSAEENIRFIRDAMEKASTFTAVPGWGNVAIGALALAVAMITAGVANDLYWVAIWVGAAAAAFSVTTWTMSRKVRIVGVRLFSGSGARFWSGLLPTLAAGALLTIPLVRAGATDLLPTAWMLLYGAAIVTAGAHSIRPVPLMGLCFMVAGAIVFFVPSRDAAMAIGFGGLHVVFGYMIARKHGG